MRKLPLVLRVFLLCIYFITAFSFLLFIKIGYISLEFTNVTLKDFLFFSILAVLTESFTTSFKKVSFSTTFVITTATYVLFGPFICIIVLVVGYSFRVIKLEDNTYLHILNTPYYGTLCNYCSLMLPILLSNYFYKITGGKLITDGLSKSIPQLILFSCTYFIINSLIISILVSINQKKNFIYYFASNLRLMLLNILAMTPFGVVLAFIYMQYNFIGVILALLPLVLARYTFSLYIRLQSQYVQTVDALMHSIEARDKYTEGHSQRVAQISMEIARKLKYNEWRLEQLNMAAMLHDVGKIGISDTILNKPGKLTDNEFLTIKNHPVIGYNILKEIKNLESVSEVVKHHHERYDGKGYPDGKRRDELSMDIYIIQLADSVDAMATDRPYRKALSQEQIIKEIELNSGTQFHPKVAEIYLNILKSNK